MGVRSTVFSESLMQTLQQLVTETTILSNNLDTGLLTLRAQPALDPYKDRIMASLATCSHILAQDALKVLNLALGHGAGLPTNYLQGL